VNREQTYKAFFQSLGYRHVSVDTNGEDGALQYDLRQPLRLGTFDMVTNIGTSEHVGDTYEEQTECWRNMLEAMHTGSVLVCNTPAPGAWPWHGVWYPTVDFYKQLAKWNGLAIVTLYEAAPLDATRCMVFARMVKTDAKAQRFRMPDSVTMYRNEMRVA
jgi:hypothetical protein